MSSKSSVSEKSDIAARYKKLDDISHVLLRPNTYVGCIDKTDTEVWIFDEKTGKIKEKTIEYNAALYKLFDEAISNARDHYIRMENAIASGNKDELPVTNISVDISRETGKIKISNNGSAIPIEIHPEHKIHVIELIFSSLRSSTNYNDEETRNGAGVNGVGVKCSFIFSKYARVEVVDQVSKKRYVQEYKNNLREICPPVITKTKACEKSLISIEFIPEYERFGFKNGLTDDILSVFKKRTFDIAAVTDKSVKVFFNGELLPVKTFKQYVGMFIDSDDKIIYEENGKKWEYAIVISPENEFKQVSWVNGIFTRNGGRNCDYIINQITKKIVDYIEKKKKVAVRVQAIKEQLMLFLRCDLDNPQFDSQSKDCMTSAISKFGSTCYVSDAFCEKVAKMGVMETALNVTQARENREAAKKTDGKKTKVIRGINNFIDANFAGTERSGECTLILCEGLSAQSGVVSGLSSNDRNLIGIYPLKGKVLNVRGETSTKIAANKEITDLKKILGLENGRTYTPQNLSQYLRYGKVMILTDADTDGSHIKALCVNLFHCEWTSLIRASGFLSFMNTPIIRATRGKQTLSFYHDGEYETWKTDIGEAGVKGWKIKYFKGLGTSTSEEFREYFRNKKQVDFVYTDNKTDDKIDSIFNKKRTDERKAWLENYDKNARLDTSNPTVTYENFIDKELIHFSVYDCERSIPNLMDGLKISLRKVLYTAFKRRLTTEIKVAQFSGSVSETSCYHHGEQSLNSCIVNMAQNFTGSNNINLLEPKGQFGTRLQGGNDSASERYIFTQLNELTRSIFPEADDKILTYLNDDGTMVEPEYYVPIIPFVLVNGSSGIGTGFSTSIPPYNPMDLVENLRERMRSSTSCAAAAELIPYYEGFKGTVEKIDDAKYLITGCYTVVSDDKITITELPIGTWTMPYLSFLEDLSDPSAVDKAGKKIVPAIKDLLNLSTETNVHIDVTFPKGALAKLIHDDDDSALLKLLKLTTTISTTNMHLFTSELKLKKYSTVDEIITDYYTVRLDAYVRRKKYLMDIMQHELKIMTNRARYITEILEDVIDLRRKTAKQVYQMLRGRNYDPIIGGIGGGGADETEENETAAYKYLTKMPMDSVSVENVAAILREKEELERKYAILCETTEKQMWLSELDVFEEKYSKYKNHREHILGETNAKAAVGAKKKTTTISVKKMPKDSTSKTSKVSKNVEILRRSELSEDRSKIEVSEAPKKKIVIKKK